MSSETVQTMDLNQLSQVCGGNSYVRECIKGAAHGAAFGIPGGPKAMLVSSALGCLGGVAANAYERNF